MKRIVLAALAMVVALTSLESFAGADPRRRARLATRYIAAQQADDGSLTALFNPIADTSDAILALVAARRGPRVIDRAVSYLRGNLDEVQDLGEKAKVVLALVAAERGPRSFGGRNLVSEIKDERGPSGQYGSNQFSAVFDHALAMLALAAANAEIPRASVVWLVLAQCEDGGWQFDQPAGPSDDEHCSSPEASPQGDFTTSDTNTSAYAVMALNARPSTVPLASDPFEFFASARDEFFGGWAYSPINMCTTRNQEGFCYRTDASSTSLVLQAFASEDLSVPQGGRAALVQLQAARCGSDAGAFASGYEVIDGEARRTGPDLFATIQVVPGLLLKPLPLAPRAVSKPVPGEQC